VSVEAKHGPKVVVPPPLLFAAGFLLGTALRRLAPGDALPASLAGPARFAGGALAVAGFALALSGIVTFFRARTTVIPHKAASTLVIRGPYRFTRNPMYTGLSALYVGLAFALDRLWPLALLPIVVAVLVAAVILPEERYLEARFGDDYRAYRGRVPRFL
jgi:protein-S-isoprenylcysteine O-methyltransferase Ste14